jgi:outer membrane protein assembly factor BamB
MPPRPWAVVASLASSVVLLSFHNLAASDHQRWPQWGGPTRDFRLATEAAPWPEGGPRLLWKRAIGSGYAGVVAAGETLYTLDRQGENERVVAVSAESGETLWTHEYEARLPEWMRTNHGVGPRSTPLLAGSRLFTVGIDGTLHCLERAQGKVLWKRELVSGLGGSRNSRGYASSPLALGDLVVAPVGGRGQSLVALRQEDGEVAWKAGDFDRGLSSPFVIDVGGESQIVALLNGAVAGFEPSSGRLLWSHPHGGRGERNVSTPVFGEDGLLFVSSAYGGGSRMLRLVATAGKTEVSELWSDEKVRVMFTNALRIGGHVYASSGDFGPVPLTAVAVETGEVAWRDRTFGRLSMVRLGERVLVLDEGGALGLVSLSPEGLTVHSRVQLVDEKAWTVPTVVGRRVYVRTETVVLALELP